MKLTDRRSSVAFFVFCSAVVLAAVDGKTASAGSDDKSQIVELTAELSQSVGRNSKLENLLAASVSIIAELNRYLTTASRSNTSTLNTSVTSIVGPNMHNVKFSKSKVL